MRAEGGFRWKGCRLGVAWVEVYVVVIFYVVGLGWTGAWGVGWQGVGVG